MYSIPDLPNFVNNCAIITSNASWLRIDLTYNMLQYKAVEVRPEAVVNIEDERHPD